MYSAIVFLPLLGFLIAGLLGKKIGDRASEIVTTALLFVSCALSWITFFDVGLHDGHFSAPVIANWLTSGDLKIDWALRVDTLTSVMLIVVTTVSALVHLYSIGYMHEDKSRPRFFAYLSLFTFAMLMLVTSDNLAQMFFGWEGVGLASYLLIGFWFEKPSANAAAIKAFVVNRVGDFGFSLGMFLVFMLTGSISFDVIFAAAPDLASKSVHAFGLDWNAMTLACLLLFMGAMGKSAQFLLHTWLPDAMEGPTPVSALIHAATMVTAGVFMVARLSPLFEQSATALTVVTLVGGITAFFAATVGLVQNDIKRVIAYSTCSQLGYMFVGLGCGGYALGIFHLFTHAFFKALLFLGAGSVIHAMHHEQDMRQMGGLWSKIPVTFACMTIGTLALTGFPLTAGYFSKDAIIEGAFAAGAHSFAASFAFVLLVVAAGMTSFYSWRLVFMTFFGERRWSEQYKLLHPAPQAAHGHGHGDDGHGAHDDPHGHHIGEPHESPATMMVPLFVLSAGALAAGYAFKDQFIGHEAGEFWRTSLFTGANNHILHEMHEIPAWVGYAPFAMMVGGFVVALAMYVIAPKVPAALAEKFPRLYLFLLNKWYFDELYDKIFVKPAFALGRLFWKGGDGAIIDRFGPDGVAARVLDGAGVASRLQTGFIYNYAFAMLLGVAALITYGLFALGGGQ
ncbi:NADH dehydrogenase subunit L [Rhodoblastus acidophilus]|uniref:NADH dehydrogenase subunit L n=1 Tax=Rhodoblastus acidophilus TaxID=1074 RepID=A0A212QF01_RHOAC|nr:NADH-quinone oxidoreductase subunit L [Rhodoblastus acidophilus]PPQ40024.1 NADH-quinone oxidoreductase subunit L [Rhodoblastus acidophilus]RAI22333.1 NADH-quinone oxidoreductase subunit L [Rhodoblastus acidophilus]SNB57936.1 NADH dehydrogenase subunit L [Rhodoblastus acidophilus]